jgi:hypothetical protein
MIEKQLNQQFYLLKFLERKHQVAFLGVTLISQLQPVIEIFWYDACKHLRSIFVTCNNDVLCSLFSLEEIKSTRLHEGNLITIVVEGP